MCRRQDAAWRWCGGLLTAEGGLRFGSADWRVLGIRWRLRWGGLVLRLNIGAQSLGKVIIA